jgi:multidrug resistance efflux pump
MRGKWVLIAVGAVAAGVGGGALSLHLRRQAAPVPPRAGAAVVQVSGQATWQGNIRPRHITGVGLPPGIDGVIDSFFVDAGQEVFEGQPLARIGAAGLEGSRDAAAQALERAQESVSRTESAMSAALLEQSRAEADAQRARGELDRVLRVFSRQKTLIAAGATPRLTYEKTAREFEQAQADFDLRDKTARTAREHVQSLTAELAAVRKVAARHAEQLEDARTALDAAEVRAPVDGLVVARHGEPGQPASEAGKDLFEIATDLYELEVAIDPPPAALAHIHPGQPALVLVLDLQSASLPGEVRELKDNQVIVDFSSNLPAIRPGMRADVRLKLD